MMKSDCCLFITVSNSHRVGDLVVKRTWAARSGSFIAVLLLTLTCFQQSFIPAEAASGNPNRVLLETELGDIIIEVNTIRAPLTSANFLRYVDGRFYDG